MKNTQNIASLIAKLEYEVGRECYNPNSYDGYTGIEGLGYRYPVKVYQKRKYENIPWLYYFNFSIRNSYYEVCIRI